MRVWTDRGGHARRGALHRTGMHVYVMPVRGTKADVCEGGMHGMREEVRGGNVHGTGGQLRGGAVHETDRQVRGRVVH